MNKKKGDRKLPVILEREELEAMLSLPNIRYLTSLRDRAIMMIMANCGLRVSEVVNLRPGDINLTERKLRVVNGKGGVDREIPFKTLEATVNTLKEWKKRKPQSDYFFSTVRDNKAGADYTKTVKLKKDNKTKKWDIKFNSKRGSQLSVRAVQSMIKQRTKQAGITKPVSCHTLRHTFATNYYRKTKDLETLRILLGHADLSTTQIYVTLANIDVENGMNQYEEYKTLNFDRRVKELK
jgi:site-specific recombinase XerD